MSILETTAPNFARAVRHWPGAELLASHFQDLDETLERNGPSTIELTKSFLECVCLTIVQDSGDTPEYQNTTELLRQAMATVGLARTREANRFNKLLSGYFKLTDAVAEFRNRDGTVAHGSDGFVDVVGHGQTRMLVLAVDCILGLLLGSLEGAEPNLRYTRRHYETFSHYSSRIDECVSCRAEVVDVEGETDDESGAEVVVTFKTQRSEIVSLRLRPSEVLFAHDRVAYVEALQASREFQQAVAEDDSTAEGAS